MPYDRPSGKLRDLTLAIKDGTHGTHARVADGVPFLSAKNVTEGGEIQWDASDSQITEHEYRAIQRSFQLHADDLLLTIVGSIGRRAVYQGQKMTFQRSVAYIRPDPTKLRVRYLFHATASRSFQRQLVQRSNATAQAGLYLGELEQTTIPLPSFDEQTRIAAILDTLDDTIRQTEQVIAKLQQMKQGLLHDLLTRGIDENGEVRDPEQRPDLFKDSVLGRIPRGWEVRRLGTLASLQAGFAFPSSVFAAEGVPVIRMSDLRSGSLDVTSAVRVPHSFVRSHADFVLRDGDLVLGMSGSLENRAVVDDRDGPALLNQRVGRFVLNDAKLFLYRMLDLYIGSSFYLRQMRCEAVGAAQLNISSGQVEGTLVPLPPLHEQGLIIERWQSLERHIAVVQPQLVKLRLLKQGLMDDLLTGKVRVPVKPA